MMAKNATRHQQPLIISNNLRMLPTNHVYDSGGNGVVIGCPRGNLPKPSHGPGLWPTWLRPWPRGPPYHRCDVTVVKRSKDPHWPTGLPVDPPAPRLLKCVTNSTSPRFWLRVKAQEIPVPGLTDSLIRLPFLMVHAKTSQKMHGTVKPLARGSSNMLGN